MKLELIRIESTIQGTLGVLRMMVGEVICTTLEPQWYNNKKNDSCIPVGVYCCERESSPKYGNVFQVKDVPQRSHILIHAGNILADTDGCILLGNSFGYLNDKRAVLGSRDALAKFMRRLAAVDAFALEVVKI